MRAGGMAIKLFRSHYAGPVRFFGLKLINELESERQTYEKTNCDIKIIHENMVYINV